MGEEERVGGGSEGPSSPVMLATMTPVSVLDSDSHRESQQYPEQKVIYLQEGDGPSYQHQPTVLVLSELVDDISPILNVRQVSEVRRWSETSDLTSFETRSSPENLDCYDEASRASLRTRLMAGSAGGGGILSASGAGLKGGGLELGAQQIGDIQGLFGNRREPEDLRKQPDKRQHKLLLVSSPSGAQGQDLVVDVVNNNAGVKAEFSPRNGTPPPSTLMSHEGVELLGDVKYGSAYTEPASYSGYLTPRPPPPPPTTFADSYYREYLAEQAAYARPFDAEGSPTASFVERYVRQSSVYHNKGVIAAAGLTVDLPSPDSGIGADTVAPRDQQPVQQGFDYSEVCGSGSLLNEARSPHFAIKSEHASPTQTRSRPWHDFGRQTDADKIQIPKLYSNYGFKYFLETPISTNQRRDDDRVTYINKGQFYGITMEYVPDPDRPLKTQTVKSVVMLMFREEKSPEDEIKAWQFWHGRQHSVKQRILDADTKNSIGFIGCIEEVAHNAVAVYWNPLESSAKLNVAIQCLSTDFSSQKGVKGLPLHIQIDTYEDHRDGPVFHRGYCQIKVFCDKGAERKTRDEERRAQKRKMAATGCASGRKKMEELYHQSCERSEFYSMADLAKPPVLFSPAEDIDKLTSMELQGFYGHETDTSSLSNGEAGSIKQNSQYLLHSVSGKPSTTTAQTLKFHHHFPPDTLIEKKEDTLATTDGSVYSSPPIKRQKVLPPLNERVMLYVRQDNEEVYTPLHVAPPDTSGLLKAIENKYKISASSISNLYRKNRKGILAKIDDDMLKYYCNEDLFLLEVRHSEESEDLFDVILVEFPDN